MRNKLVFKISGVLPALFTLLFAMQASAQCVTGTYTLDPPPVDGAYTPGQTVEVCGTISFYQQTGANWIHGIIPNFPPGWDITSYTDFDAPASCDGNGTWIWVETVVGNLGTYGPGWFYDRFNTGSVFNWGDACSSGDWEFCLTVTLSDDCGGPGNPLDGESIIPNFTITGDGESGSWGAPPTAGSGCLAPQFSASVSYPTIDFDCCDAQAGGSPGTLLICENGTFNLQDELIPPFDAGGTWSGPAGWPVTPFGTFDPLTHPAGDYTYTVLGTDDCESQTTITMAFNDLGIVQFPGYCQTADIPLINLVTNVTLPPGGTWTYPPPGGGVVPGGILDPINDPPGVYTYTFYDANNCLTTASIDITLASGGGSAGIPTTVDICTSDGSFFLLDILDGNPTGGGQWIHEYIGPPLSFVNFYPNSNVLIDPTNLADNSLFTYALGIPPCTPSFVQLTVNVFNPVDVGEFTAASVCVTDAPLDLTTLLDGTPDTGLDWSDINGNPITMPFDPSTVPVNTTLTFVYSGGLAFTSCFASQVLELTVLPDNADAGDPNTITVCESDPFFFMTDSLLGTPQPGGEWTNSGGVVQGGGFFVPGSSAPGTYTYTVSSTCGSDATTLVINVLTTPDPGQNGVLNICDNDVNIPLITGLNGTPAPTGTWTLGGVAVSPTVNGNAVNDGDVYTYITGSPLCQESATVTINLQNAPFAGTATTTPQIYCTTDPAFSLFTLLATPPSATNGTWTGPSGFTGATLNPATATTGNYTYTMPNTGCGGDTETIFITIESAPNAGNNATTTVCPNAVTAVNLLPFLGTGVTSGGTWTGPSGASTGTFNPGDPAGPYVYEVSSPSGQCTDQATVTVQFTTLPNPGTSGVITFCESDPPFPLTNVLGGGVSALGNWIQPDGSVMPGGSTALFIPGTTIPGTFTYSVPVAGCPAVTSTVEVTVISDPNPGTNGSVVKCESEGTITLISELPGNPDAGGTWTDSGGNVIPGSFDVSGLGGTTQVLTYTVGSGACVGSATLTIIIEQLKNAGPDLSFDFCGTNAPFNLTTLLDPSADAGTFLGGPNIVLNAAASGDYTYQVVGNQCPNDQATYTLSVDNPITTSGLSVACTATQTEYVVQFTINGGDGVYNVSGGTGTLAGNVFTSAPIPSGTNYCFTISDTGICADANVCGDSPSCICTAEGAISGTTTICAGGTANIIFNLQGNGPFDVTLTDSNNPGNPIVLNDINNGHSHPVNPTTTTTYTLTVVSDISCTGVINGGPVTVTVNPANVVANVQETPDANAENYTVSFNVSGGSGTYFVLPAGGNLTAGTYTSAPIPCGQPYTFSVDDTGPCPAIPVENSNVQCPCISQSGTIPLAPIAVCANENAQISANGDAVLDGNDGQQYVLHNGSANAIGTVLATSNNGSFSYTPALTYGQTYYISVVVGNMNGAGNVILSHPCTSVSTGVAVVFNALPSASISGAAQVCPGESVDLTITLTGTGPWNVNYNIGGVPSGSFTSSNNTYTLTTNTPGTYTITSVTDANCPGTGIGQAVISNFVTPTATMAGNPEVCENSGNGPVITFTGQGPFTFVYAIDGLPQPPITTNSNLYTIPAEESGLYTLLSMEGGNCDGAVSGSLDVEIIERPTALLTGGGAICDGEVANFNIQLTGNGPWSVQYSVDGVPKPILNINTANYNFQNGEGGDYLIASVVDQNCVGTVLQSEVSLDVAPIPSGEIVPDEFLICIGQELNISFNLQGIPPFDIIYAINGDTLAANGVSNTFIRTLNPTGPVIAELISITDGSVSGCNAQPGISAFVQVSELPNAPVLTNDTICAGSGPVSIGVPSVPGLSYSWSPVTGLSDPNVSNPTATLENGGLSPRTFAYVLTAGNGECFAQDTVSITVDPGPRAYFSYTPREVSSEDPRVQFTNLTTGRPETTFFWTFDTLGTSESRNPVFRFPDTVIKDYKTTLIATDPLTGCQDVYETFIPVKPEMLIFVPNAFTPDGDGLNELWGPVLSNVDAAAYKLTIYDRFGQVVFQTRDPKQKWNGGMNGSDFYVQSGVYSWVIEAKNNINQEEINFTGLVTVVR